MNRSMRWLTEVFAPKTSKLVNKPWMAGLSAGMQKIIPFILVGSLVFFYNVFRSYLPALPDLGPIANYSFFLIALITVFMLTNQLMEKLRHPDYTVNAAITSICVFLMMVHPTTQDDGTTVVDWGRLGPMGLMVAIVVALAVALVFDLYAKLRLFKNSSLPDFLLGWINNIIPITATLGLGALLVDVAKVDVFAVITAWFEPISEFGQTLPGLILCVAIPTFFYSLGVSAWAFSGVTLPIFLAGSAANQAAIAAGGVATSFTTVEVIYGLALITLGGTGATLALNLLMLRSKAANLRTIGRIFIVPSIFNINEPLVYGTPIVYNPLLMIPMWINGITGPTILWAFMNFGWMNAPTQPNFVGQVPAPISSVLFTNDFRAVLCWALLLLVYLATWYPFFKAYERQLLTGAVEEAASTVAEPRTA